MALERHVGQPRRWHELMNALTAIRGRAQATRRRVERAKRLSRAEIVSDLVQIEARTDRLAALLLDDRMDPPPTGADPGERKRGRGRTRR